MTRATPRNPPIRMLGINEDRLRLEWISAAEGARFAGIIDEFTDRIRELGPSPVGHDGMRPDRTEPVEEVNREGNR